MAVWNLNVKPDIEDDEIPEVAPIEHTYGPSGPETVFSQDIRSDRQRDKDTICGEFSCVFEEDLICHNSLSVYDDHPCAKWSCEFFGNCYLCMHHPCDDAGGYILSKR